MPRDHAYRLPRKVRRVALRSALTDRANGGRVVVIDSIDLPEVKTRAAWDLMKKLGVHEDKVLVLVEELTENLALSVRNLPNVVALEAREVNTYTVVAADWVVVTKGGLEQLQEVLG